MVMKNPCHYPDLCAKGAFSSSRSDGLNLAVGFNPRVGAIIHPPSRQHPDLCAKGAFSSSRSDGLNLAVGFNPRVGAIIHPPSRQRRLNPDGGSPTHTTFVVINPWPCPWHWHWHWSVQSSLRDGGNI